MALLERGDDRSATGPLLVAAHLRPTPRVALGQILHSHGVTAAMDVSDGLLGDLPKILDASAVGAEIELTALPILPAVRALFPDQAETFALRGGEDYELLMTVPEHRFRALRDAARDLAATLTPIGRIVERGDTALALLRNGERTTAATGAFDHFG
jgi:thiamine-monophosphate kinase